MVESDLSSGSGTYPLFSLLYSLSLPAVANRPETTTGEGLKAAKGTEENWLVSRKDLVRWEGCVLHVSWPVTQVLLYTSSPEKGHYSPAIICTKDALFQSNLAPALILNFLEEDLHTVEMCEGRRVPDCREFPDGSSCLLNWCLMQGLGSLVLEILLPGPLSPW